MAVTIPGFSVRDIAATGWEVGAKREQRGQNKEGRQEQGTGSLVVGVNSFLLLRCNTLQSI